ncbi:unnamed protein product [Lampetra planeri]
MIAVWTRGRGRGESDSGVPASGVNFAFSAGLINNDDEQWRLVCAEGRARRRGRRGAERGRRGAERGRRAGAGATEPERDRGRDAIGVAKRARRGTGNPCSVRARAPLTPDFANAHSKHMTPRAARKTRNWISDGYTLGGSGASSGEATYSSSRWEINA